MVPTTTPSGPVPDAEVFAVRATGVDRAFGGVQALRDASFAARPGEIHALAGENGAGKSTMIKVLCGVISADRGEVEIFGQPVRRVVEPAARRQLGVATAFQELSLLPDLTVAENLLLDEPPRGRWGLVRRGRLVPVATEILERHGVDYIDPRVTAAELSVAQRQVVELVRVLATRPRVMILDEPTAALPDQQVEWLSAHMRRLRDEGCCVIFTSHRWREIEALADRVTVFRNGTWVATREQMSEAEAITLMSGRTFEGTYPDVTSIPIGGSALRVDRPAGRTAARGLLRPAPRRDPRRRRAGRPGPARPVPDPVRGAEGGRRVVAGRRPGGHRPPAQATRSGPASGIAYVPEDRKAEGLFLPLSIRDNIALATLPRRSAAGFVDRNAERGAVA